MVYSAACHSWIREVGIGSGQSPRRVLVNGGDGGDGVEVSVDKGDIRLVYMGDRLVKSSMVSLIGKMNLN